MPIRAFEVFENFDTPTVGVMMVRLSSRGTLVLIYTLTHHSPLFAFQARREKTETPSIVFASGLYYCSYYTL